MLAGPAETSSRGAATVGELGACCPARKMVQPHVALACTWGCGVSRAVPTLVEPLGRSWVFCALWHIGCELMWYLWLEGSMRQHVGSDCVWAQTLQATASQFTELREHHGLVGSTTDWPCAVAESTAAVVCGNSHMVVGVLGLCCCLQAADGTCMRRLPWHAPHCLLFCVGPWPRCAGVLIM